MYTVSITIRNEGIMDNIRKYIKIGTTVDSRFGIAKVTGIEMVEEGRKDGGIEMDKIFYADKDRWVCDRGRGQPVVVNEGSNYLGHKQAKTRRPDHLGNFLVS
jgi:hypothetical protein